MVSHSACVIPKDNITFKQDSRPKEVKGSNDFLTLFPLASLLRTSMALHSLRSVNSVQQSMPEMFRKVVHILLISFPGVASLVQGYSRAAAESLGMWHLHVHLLGQRFPQATLACWAF